MRYPTWTIYTDNMPAKFGGCAGAFVVRIRPKYRDDAGLHAHEDEHVRQWYAGVLIGALVACVMAYLPGLWLWSAFWPLALIAGCFLHPLAYLLPRYRLWAEVRAYRIQLNHYPDDRSRLFAGFLASKYRLEITPGEALNVITKG